MRSLTGALIAVAIVTYAAALAVPFLILQPGLSGLPELDTLVELFLGLDFDPVTFDLSDTVVTLAAAGQWGLAAIVFVVAILCPTLKLAGLAYLWLRRPAATPGVVTKFLKVTGRLSMVDVLVVAVLVVLIKKMPGNSSIDPQVGFTLFTVSAFASFFAGILLDFTPARPTPRPVPVRAAYPPVRRVLRRA